MKITPELYSDMTRQISPKSNYKVNITVAFLVGGTICALGQILLTILKVYGLDQNDAGTWTQVWAGISVWQNTQVRELLCR